MKFVKLTNITGDDFERDVYIDVNEIVFFQHGDEKNTYLKLRSSDNRNGESRNLYFFIKEEPEEIAKRIRELK